MGTPAFAVPSLQTLYGMASIAAVYTKPDSPAGRGRKVEMSAIKKEALSRNLIVVQPKSLRPAAAIEALRALAPDLIVVAAYALILPQAVLDIPPHGCINVHASLLPQYRGASPIEFAILNGESETGVTLMQMEAGLDTGPIIAQRSLPIDDGDTTETLGSKLAAVGADLLHDTLPSWLAGHIAARPQDHTAATMTRMIKKEDGLIDWSRPAEQIARQIRAYTPWPGAVTAWSGEALKVVRARAVAVEGSPGCVSIRGGDVLVGTGMGSLRLEVVLPAGKRAMPAIDFARGRRDFDGAHLGAGA